MKRLALVAAIVVALLAVDWYMLGVGPLPMLAKSRCAEAMTGDRVASYGGKSAFRSLGASHEACEDAYRLGDLTVRGGIG
ncbi:MAG: hypothetical protein JWM90_2127 [Thermoleophilia bacterium]|nr:hypothetical protein [Thermoleophilia bacterium]